MYLKYFPQDADLGVLVQSAMDMTQTALLRAYEIVEFEARAFSDDERSALETFITMFQIAEQDAMNFKKRFLN